MTNIPQSPEDASPPPLICKKCGAEVPPGKIVCDCFRIDASRETRQRKLEFFFSGRGFLYLATASTIQARRHILPTQTNTLALCELQNYNGKPETRTITPADNLKDLQACDKCVWVLEKARPK